MLSFSFFSLCWTSVTNALPTGGEVAAGNVTINASASQMQIEQTSARGIINWQTFNVGAPEHVHFQQPDASAITLNRINPTQGPSSIMGSLTANGQVWLVNPAGIWIGPSAHVDVAGLVATTANISDENFLNGNYHFFSVPGWHGVVTNAGQIIIRNAGLAALIAEGVTNTGYIEANLGTVILGSGSAYTINFSGNQLISFVVDPVSTLSMQNNSQHPVSIDNSGVIKANGGKVIMTAKTASTILDRVINMKGVVVANSVAYQHGEIVIDAAGGTVNVTGKLIAKGEVLGEKGGKIIITGDKIHFSDQAYADVSGQVGAGQILIGGDYQGKNTQIANAKEVTIDPNVILKADAISFGSGGKVIIWSDANNYYAGSVYARGGAEGGDGGFVEVSGKENLIFLGKVDTSAKLGNYGTLLLDPKFLIVQTSGGSAYNAGVNNLFANNALGTNTITPASINTAAATNNIILQANTDITFSTNLNINSAGSSGKSITVQAGRSILVNANITTNDGALTMTANDPSADNSNRDTGIGSITMASGTTLNTGSADIILNINSSTTGNFSPGDITTNILTENNVTATTPGTITLNGNITAAGTVNLTANTAITQSAGRISGPTLIAKTLNNSGAPITLTSSTNNLVNVDLEALTANGLSNAAGAISYRDTNSVALDAVKTASTFSLTASGSVTQTGALVITGGATFTASAANTGFLLASAANTFNTTPVFTTTGLGTIRDLSYRNDVASPAMPTLPTGLRNVVLIFTNSAMQLPTLTATGTLSATAGGDITQSGPLTVTSNTSTFEAGTHDITLNNASNNFNTFAITSGNNVNVNDTNALILGDINATNLTVTSAALTDTGTISVSNLTSLNTGASSITLNSPGNDFNTVQIPSANNVTLVDTNALDMGASDIAGTFSLTTGGNITQSGILTVGSTSTLNAATHDITLNTFNNTFGTVAITSANNASIFDSNALALGSVTLTGALSADAGGSITQTGANTLNISGGTASTFNVRSASADILLDNANTFTTAPVFSASGSGSIRDITYDNTDSTATVPSIPTGVRNLQLVFTNAAIVLPSLTLSGTLKVTTGSASGAISQSGALNITGTTTLAAGAANDITLTNTSNDFSNIAITNGNNVSLRDQNALNINASTVTGDLTVTTGDTLSDGGNIIVNGTNGLILNTVNGFTLNQPGNQIAKLNATNSGSGTLRLVTTVPLTITAFSNTGTGTVNLTDTGTLTVANGVTVNANNAALSITAKDLSLSTSGALSSGTAATTITQKTAGNSIGLGNAVGDMNISGSELQRITTGNLNIDAASDGQILVAGVTTSDTAQIAGTTTLTATGGTTGSISFLTQSSTFNKALTMSADTSVNITNGVMVATQDANLTISASSLNMNSSGSLNSGTGDISITSLDSLGIGSASGQSMVLSSSMLSRMTAENLSLLSTRAVLEVDNVALADINNIANTVNLTGSGANASVSFDNNASYFKQLDARANEGITVNAPITTTVGNITMDGNTAGTTGALTLNANLNAAGSISLSSSSGALAGINLGTDVQLTSNGITFNDPLNGNYNLGLNAGSGDITFNANVGNTTSLQSIQISNVNNVINNGLIQVGTFTENAGNSVSLGNNGLSATSATIVANDVTGKVNVGGLGLNSTTANLTGFVHGAGGRAGILNIRVLNTLLPRTHYFDGLDMFNILSTQNVQAQNYFAGYLWVPNPMASAVPMVNSVKMQELENGVISNSALTDSLLIEVETKHFD